VALKIEKSSVKTFTIFLTNLEKMAGTHRWKVPGALHNPKVILRYTKGIVRAFKSHLLLGIWMDRDLKETRAPIQVTKEGLHSYAIW